MTRVDLDAVQAQAEADDYDENSGVPGWYPQTVLALVAELRTARERLVHVRDLPMALHQNCADCDAIFGGFRP